MSAHLSWMIIRNNSAFLMKRRLVNKPFSTEPNNLANLNSFKYNGLIHKKSLGIAPAADKKGFVLTYKKAKRANKPGKSTVKRQFKAGPRRSLHKLKQIIKKNHYRVDLTKVALRRASAILRSQKAPKKSKAKQSKPE